MRMHILVVLACVGVATSSGQIVNGGFEFWTTDPDSNRNPVGWETTNSFPLVNVEPVTPGFAGTYAMRVKTVNAGITLPGIALLETSLHVAQTPRKLSVSLKATIMPGDQALIMLALFRGDTVVAAQESCTFKIKSSVSQFTTMEFPLAIQTERLPDSLILIVASGLVGGTVGTELIVDELALTSGAATAVTERGIPKGDFALEQNYPNPFNPSTTIEYTVGGDGGQGLGVSGVKLAVYDMLGREVAVLVDEEKAPGSYSTKFDAAGLPSGVYYYRLHAGDRVDAKKFILMK